MITEVCSVEISRIMVLFSHYGISPGLDHRFNKHSPSLCLASRDVELGNHPWVSLLASSLIDIFSHWSLFTDH